MHLTPPRTQRTAIFRPLQLKRTFELAEKVLPVKYHRMHVIYVNKVVELLLKCSRPFMSSELYNSLVFHHDEQSLFEVLPREKCPTAIGGNCEEKLLTDDELYQADQLLSEYWARFTLNT